MCIRDSSRSLEYTQKLFHVWSYWYANIDKEVWEYFVLIVDIEKYIFLVFVVLVHPPASLSKNWSCMNLMTQLFWKGVKYNFTYFLIWENKCFYHVFNMNRFLWQMSVLQINLNHMILNHITVIKKVKFDTRWTFGLWKYCYFRRFLNPYW